MINDKNIKILFIHNTLPWYRVPLFEYLSSKLNIKYIFTRNYLINRFYSQEQDLNKVMGINYVLLKEKYITLNLMRLMFKEDYDLVIAPPFDSFRQCIDSSLVFIIAKIRRKPIIYFGEKWELRNSKIPNKIPLITKIKKEVKSGVKKTLERIFIPSTDACISSGTRSRQYFISLGVKPDKIFIAPDSSEVKQNKEESFDVRKKYGISADTKLILYFGRIVRTKGADFLIKAFSELEKERKDIFLLICGDGDFKNECEELAKNLQVKNIKFTGLISSEQRSIYLSQCDIFVLPNSFYNGQVEAWGLTLNEAMYFGKPVIATTATGASYDLIKNGVNGYMIDYSNVSSLYNALKILVSDNKLRAQMGLNSKKIIEENFSTERMGEGFMETFSYALKHKFSRRKSI